MLMAGTQPCEGGGEERTTQNILRVVFPTQRKNEVKAYIHGTLRYCTTLQTHDASVRIHVIYTLHRDCAEPYDSARTTADSCDKSTQLSAIFAGACSISEEFAESYRAGQWARPDPTTRLVSSATRADLTRP